MSNNLVRRKLNQKESQLDPENKEENDYDDIEPTDDESDEKENVQKHDTSTNTPRKLSKTQRIVSNTLSFIVSTVTTCLLIAFAGFLLNKLCNATLDKNRLDMKEPNEIAFYVDYTATDNLYHYEHQIFVSCQFEGKRHANYSRIFLFDGSTASTHASAQMIGKALLNRFSGKNDVLFCSYDRIGRGKTETKKTLLDSKNRFTVRHIDKDLYVRNNIIFYALEVAKHLHLKFGGKLILLGHGFGANIQSAVLSMEQSDLLQGLILMDPIQGDELLTYVRRQTNRGMFLTVTGMTRLLTQILRLPLPPRVASVTSVGSVNYLSDSTIAKTNLLLCQQSLWESARDEVDLLPALHSLVIHRDRQALGKFPVYVLISELVDPSDEDLNQAYQSIVPSSQYIQLTKNTRHKTVPHTTTGEIINSVESIVEAVEFIDSSMKI